MLVIVPVDDLVNPNRFRREYDFPTGRFVIGAEFHERQVENAAVHIEQRNAMPPPPDLSKPGRDVAYIGHEAADEASLIAFAHR